MNDSMSNNSRHFRSDVTAVGDPESFPCFEAVVSELRRIDGNLDDVIDLKSYIESFLDSGELQELIFRDISTYVNKKELRSDNFPNTWTLYNDEIYSVYIQRSLPQGRKGLSFCSSAATSLLRCIKAEHAPEVAIYNLPSDTTYDIFEVSLPIKENFRKFLTKEDPYLLVRKFDIPEIVINSSTLFFVISRNDSMPLQWIFDKSRKVSSGISMTNPSQSRIVTMVDLVRMFSGTGRAAKNGVDYLISLESHPLYHIRWKACQALAKIDRDLAVEMLGRLKSDPHPHVRRVASIALDRALG